MEGRKGKRPRTLGWLSPTESAEYMGVCRRTVYNLMEMRALPYSLVRLGKATVRRLRVDDLDAYMTRDRTMSNEEMLRKADLLLLKMEERRRSRRGR